LSQLSINPSKDSFAPTFFVDAILPLPIPKFFTYRVPKEMESQVAIGCRIVVPFGKAKILTAIIHQVHNSPPKEYEAKYIIDLLEEAPSINKVQLRFFQWLADYYMCTLGEVIQAALPSGLKINTTSLVQRNPYFNEAEFVLSIEEQLLMQQISTDMPVETARLADLVGQKKLSKVLKALIDKEAILIIDHIKEKFNPKIKKYVRLRDGLLENEGELEMIFSQLEKKPKQLTVLMAYLRAVPVLDDKSQNTIGFGYDELINEGCSVSSIKTLAKNDIIELFYKEISRFQLKTTSKEPKVLSAVQEKAKQEIIASYKSQSNVLLHGITGSGKTEIYNELIKDTLEAGHQVLYLLPEIALTSQIVSRLEGVFGSKMGVYHSKYSANERVEVWKKLLSGDINFVVGVRSSIFLPFDDLGLIIIDEEHEPSFKQYDPAPRYNARDAALMLANMHQAKTLLGSATPSLESYYLAQSGKYGYVPLIERFGKAVLPKLETVDIAKASKTKQMKGNFSNELIRHIEESLAGNEQVIIFQNRRGYAPFLSCATCGWVPKCEHCDVSLTYHQYKNELRCHYCGYKLTTPTTCSACGSVHIKTVSFGTEQLEEALQLLFPEVEIGRLDLDTTRGRNSYDKIIQAFSTGKTSILVGTQMVAKGLDFDNVGLVGIIDLDRMLHFPDFRSVERTFQLSVQVAGRAGRKEKQGKVLIQTYNPQQAIVQTILQQDYQAFFKQEIEERRLFNYPPFTRIIKLTIKDKSHQIAAEAVGQLYQLLVTSLGQAMVLGPITPSISKIRDRYLRELYLKIGRDKNIKRVKEIVLAGNAQIITKKEFKSTVVIVDVDPL